MAKREITARKAKENLEAYGYTGNAKWAEIDNFIRLNPEAKMALLANEGALVQSERLGFSNGGGTFTDDQGNEYKLGEAYADTLDLDNWEKLLKGETTGYTGVKKKAKSAEDPFKTSQKEEEHSKYQAAYKRAIAKGNEGAAGYGDYIRGRSDVRAEYFKGTEFNKNLDPNLHDTSIYNQVLQGKNVDGTILVGYTNKDGIFQPLLANDATRALEAGIVAGYGYTPEEEETTDDTPEETTTTPDTTTAPASVTVPDVTPAVTQAPVVSITPDPAELQQAQKVFSPDGVVTLPTASFAMTPVQTPTVTAPEGVTMEQAPTFQANVSQQAQDFQNRANLQAQNLQPQTLAEKTAAGTTGMIEQRLYRNPQGMTLYVTGTINPNGVWTPTTPIPQGYAPVQNFSNGGMPNPNNLTQEQAQQLLKQIGPTVAGSGGDYKNLETFNNYNFSQSPYTLDYFKQVAEAAGGGANSQSATNLNVVHGSTAPAATTGPTQTTPQTAPTATQGMPIPPNPVPPVENNNESVDDTNTDTTGGTTGGQSPAVNVGGQDLTVGQLAQGQANLSASAMLNPAGTIVAAAPSYVNPDAAGTVLSATTGQAPGVAPIVTNPAQVSQVATADTPAPVTTTPVEAQTAQEGVQTALDQTQAAQSSGPTQTIEAATQDPTSTQVGSVDAAQIDQAQKVQGAPTRTLQEGETISGSTVDQRRVGQAFGTGEVQAATVKDELTTLMQDFEEGETPAWASGAMRNALAGMASRGLGASSLAGQAAIQAAMESALPIAMADASNKQQMAMMKAEQRAKFLNMEFDQNFQSKVMNAARVSEIANMNFNAQQQVALENARMAQTVDLANLSNRQALVMAEAAQISQLETQNLSNIQQARVQNAQNFLQIDMANLNNRQQTELFKAQTLANTILSDTAAANAFTQFNASNQIQVDQFNNTMSAQLNQFNSAQTNAMAQFNAGEANSVMKFNSELQNQRETFNATMSAQIAQANAKWRQDVTLTNTAAANESNFQYAKDVNALTNKSIDQIWQRERDLMSFAMTSSENAMDRAMQLLLGDKELSALRIKLDAEETAARDAGQASLFSRFLFGSGYKGGYEGLLADIL